MRNSRVPYPVVWFCLLSVLVLSSCDIINPEEPLPTAIHLAPFDFQIQPGQGSDRHKFTEIWVYANSNVVGAFTPPVDIYYLEEGPTQFTFRPGIRNNGILGDAIVYPMVSGYTIDLVTSPGSSIPVNPVTGYKPETVFKLNADFELGNEFVDNRDTIQASALIRSNVDVFEGEYAGQITLSEEASFIEVGHAVPMASLPVNGKAVYLEFRYKSEVEMSIGLLGIQLNGQSFSNFFYLVRPSEEWNMLYIELTDFVVASALPAYKILFRSLYPANATQPEVHIFLDNIKVIHL